MWDPNDQYLFTSSYSTRIKTLFYANEILRLDSKEEISDFLDEFIELLEPPQKEEIVYIRRVWISKLVWRLYFLQYLQASFFRLTYSFATWLGLGPA